MKKIVINRRYGGFSVSQEAAQYMAARGSKVAAAELREFEKEGYWYGYGISEGFSEYERDDPYLVEAVERLGERANGSSALLKVVEIPDEVDWYISEHAGVESVEERHRSWA